MTAIQIADSFDSFAIDHTPDGWPAVQQKQLTEAAAELRRLEAQLQKETAARQAAQIEAEALKERLVRADAEKCATVLAERIAPNAPVQEQQAVAEVVWSQDTNCEFKFKMLVELACKEGIPVKLYAGPFESGALYWHDTGTDKPTTSPPDRIAQLEAANTNLFEQGQKMHKRIQELEMDCKIGAQEMVKAYEEIDNLKAQMFMHEPVTDEENERFSRDVSNFKGSDPEATKYALEEFLKNRVQPAPVQEPENHFKSACWLRTSFSIGRYLMSNAHGRWNGTEKALYHRELCKFYVAAVRGFDDEGLVDLCGEDFKAVHKSTQQLTDRMDEVIGFPLDSAPDYAKLEPLFFEHFHTLAMQALQVSQQPAPVQEPEKLNPLTQLQVAYVMGLRDAQPRKAVKLSDSEIASDASRHWSEDGVDPIAFAHAIESAVWAKNGWAE